MRRRASAEENMPLDREPRREQGSRDLIWARDDVVVTSGVNRSGVLTYYIKVAETEEIFELGEVEYSVWEQFLSGKSLEAAERAAVEGQSREFRSRFRGLVAELAIRGLLHGAIPDELLAEFAAQPRARQVRLQHQVDPDEKGLRWNFNRIRLFEPNRPFSLLARWFGFMKHAVWPIVFAAFLGGLVLIKHLPELGADMHSLQGTGLVGMGIPHILLMLFTIKLLRNIVEAAVIRYYRAEIRVFSIDFLFGFWPRFHIDKKATLRLARTPQLWVHSSPTFVRMFFFGFGALGWWWFRGDGTLKSELCLLMCRSGLFDMMLSMLPFRRGAGKNESYYWISAYFEEPFLRERALAALRSLFSRRIGAPELGPIERAALLAYGLSMVASAILIAYIVVALIMTLTGEYRGAGITLFVASCLVFGVWKTMAWRIKRTSIAEKREQRRAGRSRQSAPQMGVSG
jgi:hypothetical protein